MTKETRPGEILSFWFGRIGDDGWTAEDRGALWFAGGAKNDPEIIRRFGPALALAGRGGLDAWARSGLGTLALVVMLDQFTRCVHRGSALAFSNDARALAHAEAALARGLDREMALAHRQFLYMPLMHSEDPARQERCAELFDSLARALPPGRAEIAKGLRHHSREHRDIVARFGRFPHRNGILGRESTPAESAWLAENAGKNYGQGPAGRGK